MKKKLFFFLLLVFSIVFSACQPTSQDNDYTSQNDTTSDESTTEDFQNTTEETTEDQTVNTPTRDYRILITSDIHYTDLTPYYGVDRDTRIQYWVDAIWEEHEKKPFDLILILGDVSLDYWGWNNGGTYQRDPSQSETRDFMQRYVSKLPANVPVVVLPGNHELYTNAKWKELTGNDRSCSFVLGDNLFIMPDSYSGVIDPVYVGGGVNDDPYTAIDVSFVKNEIEKNPNCNKIFILSHHLNMDKESTEFMSLLSNDSRIVGLFSGHTHKSSISLIDANGIYIPHALSGNFSEGGKQTSSNFSWGFRDLQITKDGISTRYYTASAKYYVDEQEYASTGSVSDPYIYPVR